jgi:alpha-D-ribose 1-methylphosphonate 5-triphosphate synthase subunit PhnH
MSEALSAGFADPVGDAQRCFRALLDAIARPGQTHGVTGPDGPRDLDAATGAVILSLVDHETPLWIAPGLEAVRPWIAFHTGAPEARSSADAAFVLARALPALDQLRMGGHETPEASATVILQVASLSDGCRYTMAGPGLRTPAALTVDGLPADFIVWWAANHRLFPRGIDLILCAGNQVAALPRTVVVREA